MATEQSTPRTPCAVVMAKRPRPGRVKTRLIGGLSGYQAACVHAAMLQCVLDRLASHLPGRLVLALDDGPDQPLTHEDPGLSILVPDGFELIDQGAGDLGERLRHTWQALGGGPAVFFGVDSPDAPKHALTGLYDALKHADAAVGPVEDGGYWCLAARRYAPALITGIDWGTAAVYHQTRQAARRAGLTFHDLPPWHDVDNHGDLDALQQRLRQSDEPALISLRDRLDRITRD